MCVVIRRDRHILLCENRRKIYSGRFTLQVMERFVSVISARQLPTTTGMSLKSTLFTQAAASAQVQQFRHGRFPVRVRTIPGLRVARAIPVTCDSNQKRGEGLRSPRRSRSLNQATSASVSLSRPLMGLVVTELEFINGLCGDHGISDARLWRFQQQDDSHLQVLKISIELCKKEYFVMPKAKAQSDLKFHDEEDEKLGKKVWFQLISVEVDPETGRPKQTSSVAIEKWTEVDPEDHCPSTNVTTFNVNVKVEKDFGTPGALILKNFHRDEFLLKAVSIKLPDKSTVHFPCNSCVYNTDQYAADRVFFSNKVFLPQETPAGLKVLREQELINMRGNGTGLRKEADRIYDYAVYNDLGDVEQHESLKRPVLGGNDKFPYPRRMRTGRPLSEIDPVSENRGEMYAKFYIPKDERVTLVQTEGLEQEDAIEAASRKMMPALYALYSTQEEYKSLDQVFDLFRKGVTLSNNSKCASDSEPTKKAEEETVITFRPPKVIAACEDAWMHDEEFARQLLAGINPVAIERVREFPIRSALDTTTYGCPLSSIKAKHIEPFLEGLDVQTAVAEHKLFVLDYHDLFLPFVNKINESPTSKAYATRSLFYTRKDGTLKPIAIELSLPSCEGNNQSTLNRVVTPHPLGTEKNWTWELAKAHVMANDAGYHQLVSHWLRSHAALEPVIIATHRQLSPLHPVHQALVHHFKDTLDINAAARKALVNAGGIIEKCFTPHEVSLQMSSTWYKHMWRFDEQALPADLLKRGMAIPDDCAEHGVKLVIEDYPFAADGLELWTAIRTWLSDYVEVIYKDDASVRQDKELQQWWTEIRTVGHGDKRDAEGWPVLDSKESLVHILNIIVWTASCHHAAVNFGQYEYVGFMPNHPTTTRRLIPTEGTLEFLELQKDPEAFYLSTVSNETQATVIAITTEALSTHANHEEFLGQRATPNWTSDDKILGAFSRFQRKISEIEKLVVQRNQDKRLRHRHGPAQVPYELLHPSSDPGLTGKGVPNSASI